MDAGADAPAEALHWQKATASPQPAGADEPSGSFAMELARDCGRPEAALGRVARTMAERQTAGLAPFDAVELRIALRAEGAPYVWPRAWSLETAELEAGDARSRMRRWLGAFEEDGERRCGAAVRHTDHGTDVVVLVVVGALADLAPLPTRVRASEWIDVDATLMSSATDAKVVVLGPTGAPRTLMTSFTGDRVRARFNADEIGEWTVQVLATTPRGPRPVLEAMTFAGHDPPARYEHPVAPGEAAAAGSPDAAVALERMVRAARARSGLGALTRDEALDRVARHHAEAMRSAQRVGHDVGFGDPWTRLERVGVAATDAGENVAHARDVVFAHRTLWASPSHRGNLLNGRFDAIGIGVVHDDDGSVWVCELFVDLP
jgi:uncharacterized protein YkwD